MLFSPIGGGMTSNISDISAWETEDLEKDGSRLDGYLKIADWRHLGNYFVFFAVGKRGQMVLLHSTPRTKPTRKALTNIVNCLAIGLLDMAPLWAAWSNNPYVHLVRGALDDLKYTFVHVFPEPVPLAQEVARKKGKQDRETVIKHIPGIMNPSENSIKALGWCTNQSF